MNKQLKLYVWEDVLCDYTSGMMVAYAYDASHARALIEKKMGYDAEDLRIEPKEITEAEGFYVYGGS